MRTWGIAIVTVVLATTPAFAGDAKTFEELADGAKVLSHADVAGLAWALTAPCKDGDDVAQRQCRAARDARAAAVRDATMIVDGENAAFTAGEWSADTKSVPLTLRGCIACSEPIGGLYIVSAKVAPTWKGAVAVPAIVHETSRTFKDEAAAKRWVARTSSLHVQFVIRIAAANGGMWEREGKHGLAVDVLGFRVFDPCDGGIVCASPNADKAPADKKACSGAPVDEGASDAAQVKPDQPAAPELPAQLEAQDIKDAMKPVIKAAKACFDTYGVAGTGKLVYTIAGDGSVTAFQLTGDFADTPTGKCIEKAARAATFPHSKKKRFDFKYPISLQ